MEKLSAAKPAIAMPARLSLPVQKSIPPTDPSAFSYYIYGRQKSGKTSFASMFPDCINFFYEPSGKDYKIFAVAPRNWDETVGYIDLLEKEHRAGTLRFKNCCFDVVDLMFKQCLEHLSTKFGWGGAPPEDYGKSWALLADTFRNQVYRVAQFMGVIFISHAREKEIKRADDTSYSIMTPTSPKTCHDLLSKFCDMTGYLYIDKDNRRKLRILPDMAIEAGNRLENHFRYSDGKTAMPEIEMGRTKDEAFKNFMDAFNNKVPKPSIPPVSGTLKNPLTLSKGV